MIRVLTRDHAGLVRSPERILKPATVRKEDVANQCQKGRKEMGQEKTAIRRRETIENGQMASQEKRGGKT